MVADEINFGDVKVPKEQEEQFLDESIFGGGNFLKHPAVGEELIFTIENIKNDDKNIKGKTKEGKDFDRGFNDKNGSHKWDILTLDGSIYTVKSSEVWYALGREIKKYSAKNPNIKPVWKGAKISIKHNYDGMHSDMKLPLLKAVLSVEPYNMKDLTDEQVVEYQAKVKQAKKEFKLYTVTLLN